MEGILEVPVKRKGEKNMLAGRIPHCGDSRRIIFSTEELPGKFGGEIRFPAVRKILIKLVTARSGKPVGSLVGNKIFGER